MGFVDSIAHRHRIVLLLLSGILALLIAVLLSIAVHPDIAVAQISPLSPLRAATPVPESQPQVLITETPSPLPRPQADLAQPSVADQNAMPGRNPEQSQSQQPLIPLGEPSQAQPSLILVGALLVGLGLLVIVVLVVRRRE